MARTFLENETKHETCGDRGSVASCLWSSSAKVSAKLSLRASPSGSLITARSLWRAMKRCTEICCSRDSGLNSKRLNLALLVVVIQAMDGIAFFEQGTNLTSTSALRHFEWFWREIQPQPDLRQASSPSSPKNSHAHSDGTTCLSEDEPNCRMNDLGWSLENISISPANHFAKLLFLALHFSS